jgi:hypothetical protein
VRLGEQMQKSLLNSKAGCVLQHSIGLHFQFFLLNEFPSLLSFVEKQNTQTAINYQNLSLLQENTAILSNL